MPTISDSAKLKLPLIKGSDAALYAVPRDVEAEVAKLDDVYVYTVDDLGKVVASGKESRRIAVAQAEAIIEMRVRDFEAWLASREAVPEIQLLRHRAEEIRAAEVKKAMRHLAAGAKPEEVIEALSRSLAGKFVHDPTVLLRDGDGLSAEERSKVAGLLEEFFLPRTARRG